MATKYLSEHKDFKDLVKLTQDRIKLEPVIIEKDYWVTRILRQLMSSEFAWEFIFKGGTSLSKVWFESFGRFSEDIDILMLPTEKSSKRKEQSARLIEFINLIGDFEGFSFIEDESTLLDPAKNIIGGKFYYDYPGFFREHCPDYIKPKILLEPGYRGGAYPFAIKNINSLLAETILKHYNGEIPQELNEYRNDVLPFEIKVLNPERIFLEKLDAIMNLHRKGILESGTRHYYDIYHLLEIDSVKNLKHNKDDLILILNDISSISMKYYGSQNTLNVESIKSCEAFSTNYSALSNLKNRYEKEKSLYYKPKPDFDDIMRKISDYLGSL